MLTLVQVTILEGAKDILGGFEKQMTQPVKRYEKKKVLKSLLKLWLNQLKKITELKSLMKLKAKKTIEADYVLSNCGSSSNTDELGLEELGVKFADRGLLEVDKQKPYVYQQISMQW